MAKHFVHSKYSRNTKSGSKIILISRIRGPWHNHQIRQCLSYIKIFSTQATTERVCPCETNGSRASSWNTPRRSDARIWGKEDRSWEGHTKVETQWQAGQYPANLKHAYTRNVSKACSGLNVYIKWRSMPRKDVGCPHFVSLNKRQKSDRDSNKSRGLHETSAGDWIWRKDKDMAEKKKMLSNDRRLSLNVLYRLVFSHPSFFLILLSFPGRGIVQLSTERWDACDVHDIFLVQDFPPLFEH